MTDLHSISDAELRSKLAHYGMADIPITKTTRDLVIRRLKSAIESSSNGYSQEQHSEQVSETRQASSRRRSSAATVKSKPKPKQRASLADTFNIKNDMADAADGSNRVTKSGNLSNLSNSLVEKTNGKAETKSVSGNITDDELIRQLRSFNIPTPAITSTTKPILVKKLNHAIAKQRRESKSFTSTFQLSAQQDSEQESAQDSAHDSANESDVDNGNPSFVSVAERSNDSAPLTSVSLQPSFSFLSSSVLKSDSGLISKYLDFQKPTFSTTKTVINRFVEEQEPYDTGSDSDTETYPTKVAPKNKWRFWPLTSKLTSTSMVKTPSISPYLLSNFKSKLSILWHWQFITLVLPLSAFFFFVCLAAFYIKASYSEHGMNDILPSSEVDPTIMLVKDYIERDSISKLCLYEETVPITKTTLMQDLRLNDSSVEQVRAAVEANPQWGVTVEDDLWAIKTAKIPFSCWMKKLFWNLIVGLLITVVVGGLVYHLITLSRRQREREEQEVYALVEKIIDLLARHQAAVAAEKRPQEAFLAVTHVRDVLIPLKERKLKQKLWNKAVQFLEDNESRVRPEIQQIEGEDFRVWRWLPPSTAFASTNNFKTGDQTDDGINVVGAMTNSPLRPKVWQGQAFSTDSCGVNSPPPYPLTQCLKVRNMFDAEVEVGDTWPVRIQDAILEKADQGKILHMAVDRGSREGCVYIKCSNADEAGKVYRALHGWWFDGNLVTVKYLRPERYHYRFPDSAKALNPLQPSNDKRLSLQTKFWKSPLEHF